MFIPILRYVRRTHRRTSNSVTGTTIKNRKDLVHPSNSESTQRSRSPLLQEAASLAISIITTPKSNVEPLSKNVVQQANELAQLVLTNPQNGKPKIKTVLEILRRVEFLVKHQTPSHRGGLGHSSNDEAALNTLGDDIRRVKEDLTMTEETRVEDSLAWDDTTTSTSISTNTNKTMLRRRCLPYPSLKINAIQVSSGLGAFRTHSTRLLFRFYILFLLDLPRFYASRIHTWTRNSDPLPQTCPSRNHSTSLLWPDFDQQSDCDLDFCDRVLTTLLREWKTLRVLSSIIFASVLAMLQIERVEEDSIVSTPAYFSLLFGVMSAISATILDLYFQCGKSSPGIIAWVHSLRNISEPMRLDDDSVVLALPAISTAWSTLLFIISIIAFTFEGYSGHADGTPVDTVHHILSPSASLSFRILLFIAMIIGIGYLVMLMRTLRKISRAQDTADFSGILRN
ncbi:hypothetical protein NP233_g140 [Leucocoprinus birnbaumii]|uniref:Transmembrane protein n=1 Tax=Leucocoprinus birnbaumii TaxID=56174 RepID=A0AAD5W4G4_9AGAR|nr:hypothetical protein NP233_g140 [Leucocoprinus birnbaumii]